MAVQRTSFNLGSFDIGRLLVVAALLITFILVVLGRIPLLWEGVVLLLIEVGILLS